MWVFLFASPLSPLIYGTNNHPKFPYLDATMWHPWWWTLMFFFDRDFIARCQQSMPCLLWSPVPCSNTCTLLSNADVAFLFGHWQGKNPCDDDGGCDIISLRYIQQKTIIHTQCAENCPNGNSSPSMTNVRGNNRKPKCTPLFPAPLFLQWLNQRFANISSPDDKSNHWPPLHESAGWLSQRSSIVNQKVYPAFRLHGKRTIFEGRMKNITKVDRALDVIQLDCLISQSTRLLNHFYEAKSRQSLICDGGI